MNTEQGRRIWLLVPGLVLFVIDVALTLAGQPSHYWAGEYSSAIEANPLAHRLLVHGPALFLTLSAAWLCLVAILVLRWSHPATMWLAVGLAFGHAIGGGSWIQRIETWGLLAAVVYIAAAAQASAWCWRRFERLEPAVGKLAE